MKIDWSNGPVPCTICKRPMRPKKLKRVGQWADTVTHEARGACTTCYRRNAYARSTAEQERAKVAHLHRSQEGVELVYKWATIPAGLPMIHQEMEACADLMDYLRDQGLILLARPTMTVQHGTPAILVLRCRVTPITRDQAKAMEQPAAGRSAAHLGVAA